MSVDTTTFQHGREIPLWSSEPVLHQGGGSPGDLPAITTFLPPVWKANGKALIIFPGGAYVGLAEHEGRGYAEYFAAQGFCCFVVRYRLGGKAKGYHYPVQLNDAARAVRLVRSAAAELGVRSECIGVVGSSAGGHLAACVGNMHEQASKAPDEGQVAAVSSRPDFTILCYPVITSDPSCWNRGSFLNVLGEADFTEKNCRALSQEYLVTAQTPPAFLWHTMEDTGVLCENSIRSAKALRRAGVPFELHIYEKGSHGRGLFQGHPWATECVRWLSRF